MERPGLSANGGLRDLIKVPEVATKFAQQTPLPPAPAKKLARQAPKRPFWAILPAQGELFRAHAAYRATRCNRRHQCGSLRTLP